jgi:hypothetical protein
MCSTVPAKPGGGPVDGLDQLGALALADVVPALAVRQLVRVPLPPHGHVVLAGRGDGVVEGAERHREGGGLGGRQAGAVLAVRPAQRLPARGEQLHGPVGLGRAGGVPRQGRRAEPHHHADAVARADAAAGALGQVTGSAVAEQLDRREDVAAGHHEVGGRCSPSR